MECFIVTGANLGMREKSLQNARQLIQEKCGPVVLSSSIYETDAWGKEDQPAFLNQVLKIATSLPPGELMNRILQIEISMGRERNEKYGARTIDIDILFYGTQVIEEKNLCIPHPRMQYRRFVLEPLAEIAPAFVHPVLSKPVSQILRECEDQLSVRLLIP